MGSTDDDKKKNPFEIFVEGFKEGYDEQDAKPSKSIKEQIDDGLSRGATESLANPFKWIMSIFKSL